jgi:hypothetical protein
MANAIASIDVSPISPASRSMPAPAALDDYPGLVEPRYWPTELLATFTLLMAGHGRCVSSAMMLGDREYALWQLARAHTMDDERLRAVAVQLFSYFDDAQHWARASVHHA